MKIEAGTILVLEHGEYSDYSFDGPVRVVKDFDQKEVCDAFLAQWTKGTGSDWRPYPDESQFIAWLTKEQYVESMDNVHSWYLGSYSFNPEIQ
jgi:hypothetical protein